MIKGYHHEFDYDNFIIENRRVFLHDRVVCCRNDQLALISQEGYLIRVVMKMDD